MDPLQPFQSQLLHLCHQARKPINEILAHYITRWVIDAVDAEEYRGQLTEVQLKNLIKRCSEFLLSPPDLASHKHISVSTLRMHTSFIQSSIVQQEAYERFAMHYRACLVRTHQRLRVAPSPDAAYQHIASLCSEYFIPIQMVAPDDVRPVSPGSAGAEEIRAALSSVLPEAEVLVFRDVLLGEPDAAALDQLEELPRIVCGIRVLNLETLDSLRDVIAALDTLKNQLTDMKTTVQKQIDGFIQICRWQLDRVDDGTGLTEFRRRLAGLYNRRLLMADVDLVLDRVTGLHTEADDALSSLQSGLIEVRRLVGGRDSVPKGEVYPRFVTVSGHYGTILHAGVLAAIYRGHHSDLVAHLDAPDVLAVLSPEVLVQAQAAQPVPLIGDASAPPHPDAGMTIDEEAVIHDLQPSLRGMCPWTIVKAGGLLVPGRVGGGVLVTPGDDVLTFVDEYGALEFRSWEPMALNDEIRQLTAHFPELPLVLDARTVLPGMFSHPLLQQWLAAMTPPPQDLSHLRAAGSGGGACEAGNQTPVHFVDSHIDPDHVTSEWEMRRGVLHMAALTGKVTHSAQTNITQFKHENDAQTIQMVDEASQGRVDAATAPIEYRRYLRGLRGRPDAKFKTVHLTIDPYQ